MANVKLSASEIQLANNASIILTKNKIIESVYTMFGNLAAYYQHVIVKQNSLPTNIQNIFPKIYKGENYENLPWVMLDYPRYFTTKNSFAIRTFFWWGNFFSITLYVKGEGRNFLDTQKIRELKNWFLCVNENEWQHHFREDNYLPLTEKSLRGNFSSSFIKLSKKFEIADWDKIEFLVKESFDELMMIIDKQ